jgi:ubiquinone/menaquinone biosynthesis C-methylase UbiE
MPVVSDYETMDDGGDMVPTERMERLEDTKTYRYLSGEELRGFLDPRPGWRVVDLGSGTGFYTRELAPAVRTVYAVDIDRDMHEFHRTNGMAANVVPVTADVSALPFRDDELDGAVSTRTFHHDLGDALPEIERVLGPGGRLVVTDWSATGAGERDHARDEEYFDVATVQSRLLEADFCIRHARERRETFVITAVAP